MKIMAKAKAKASSNGKIKKLSPSGWPNSWSRDRKDPEEKEAAFKYATSGPGFKTRVTRTCTAPVAQ